MNTKIENKFIYFLNGSMYMNVTNLCTNDCVFCIRSLSDTVAGANLKLENENISSTQIIDEMKNSSISVNEAIFCGYGEPLIKLDIVKEVAAFIKQTYPNMIVRINTNGHANLVHKRNVVPELVGLIDKISISLNAQNPELYKELTQCKWQADVAFNGVKDFIAECVKYKIDTTATVVLGFKDYPIDVEKCREITESLGAKFKIREWLSEGYK